MATAAKKKIPTKRKPRTGSSAASSVDSIRMYHWVLAGVFTTFGAQVLISAAALFAIGLELSLGYILSVMVPLGIDVPILVFTGAALIFKKRGRTAARFLSSWVVFGLTAFSCYLNYSAHLGDVDTSTQIGTAALVVGTLSPLLIYINVEVLVALTTRAPLTAEQKAEAAAKRREARERATEKAAKRVVRRPVPKKISEPLGDAAFLHMDPASSIGVSRPSPGVVEDDNVVDFTKV